MDVYTYSYYGYLDRGLVHHNTGSTDKMYLISICNYLYEHMHPEMGSAVTCYRTHAHRFAPNLFHNAFVNSLYNLPDTNFEQRCRMWMKLERALTSVVCENNTSCVTVGPSHHWLMLY